MLTVLLLNSCILFILFPRSVTVCFCPCCTSCLSGLLKAPSHMSSHPLRCIWNKHQTLGSYCWGSVSCLGYHETCALLTKPGLIFIICLNNSRVIGLLWSCSAPNQLLSITTDAYQFSSCHSCVDWIFIHYLSLDCLLTSMGQEMHEGSGLASYEKLILIH